MKVVVIGAGIVGLSTGYWLAKSGADVTVIDKGKVASEASSRATGFLSLRGEQPIESPLAAEAEALWNRLDEELGYPTEWKPGGRLWVATTEDEWIELQNRFQLFSQTQFEFELIDRKRVLEIAPNLTSKVVGGIYTTRSGHGNPQRTSQAFAWALRDRGGDIREFTPALAIETANGRVTGVATSGGMIAADVVVNCAGPQIGLLSKTVGVDVPVAAVRLEAMVTTPLPPLFDVAMVANGLSLRQTRRGNIHFNGGPHEWIDVELTQESPKPNTPIVRNIALRLKELMPSLQGASILRSWAGIVEVTPDQVCIVDRLTDPEGLIVATTSGHGFGLAPAIGKAIAELATKGETSLPISGLSLNRFARLASDWKAQHKWESGSYNT